MKAVVISLPRRWKVGLLGILILGGVFLGGYYFFRLSLVPPEKLVEEALGQAFEAESYRYTLVSQLFIDGIPQTWSDISGEKANRHDLHLIGTMVNTPVELYQIGDVSYNKDPFNNRWYTVEGYDLTQQELLMVEVNPLANFNFKEIVSATYSGREEVLKHNCWVVECTADLENQMLEVLWQDFRFKFWIDWKNHWLRKGELFAYSKNNPDNFLTISVEFFDYNKPIRLEVPQI